MQSEIVGHHRQVLVELVLILLLSLSPYTSSSSLSGPPVSLHRFTSPLLGAPWIHREGAHKIGERPSSAPVGVGGEAGEGADERWSRSGEAHNGGGGGVHSRCRLDSPPSSVVELRVSYRRGLVPHGRRRSSMEAGRWSSCSPSPHMRRASLAPSARAPLDPTSL
jgi:hypothetical protein